MYLYILNHDFFPVLTVFDPMSLFLVTALSPCWPIIRSVYVFEITTTIKRVTPPRWQRSYRRAPLWLPRLFAWLENGHSECAVAILARDLGTDGTNHRICDCWIYLASPRDMPLYLCTAQKNPRRGSLTELLWSKHNGLEACFFLGGGELRSAPLQYAASNCQSAVSRRFAHISRSRKRLNKREICFIPT